MIKYIVLNDGTRYVKGSLYDDEHTIKEIEYDNLYDEFLLKLTTNGKPSAIVSVQRHAVTLFYQTIEDKS